MRESKEIMTIVNPRENESADAAVHRTQDITSERYWLNYGGGKKNEDLLSRCTKCTYLQMV